MSQKNPLNELINLGKSFFEELPKVIEEVKEQGLKAFEDGTSAGMSIPAELTIRFRKNEAGELEPVPFGESGGIFLGTYRVVKEETITPEASESEEKPTP